MCVAIALEPREKYNVSMVPAPRDALARSCADLSDLAMSRRQFDAQPSRWRVISITALATPYGQSALGLAAGWRGELFKAPIVSRFAVMRSLR
jgi:hypothetical protein